MKTWLHWAWVLGFTTFLGLASGRLGAAEKTEAGPQAVKGPVYCHTCKKGPLVGRVFLHPRGYICADCEALPTRCHICQVPIPGPGKRTPDGRLLCEWDAPLAILDLPPAEALFEETREAVARLTRGRMQLKFPQVRVQLADVDYWNHASSGQAQPNPMHRLGFSLSRNEGGRFHHNVVLWSGQRREDLRSVCAHEYTHLWLFENLPEDRNLEPQTVEGVCEAIAYVLAGHQKITSQQERILKNTYTEGRVKEVIETIQSVGLPAVLDWVLLGKEARITQTHLTRAGIQAPRPEVKMAAPTPRTYPDTLQLKGIVGSSSKRLALINNKSFAVGETQKVYRGKAKVQVKCLEIGANFVRVEIEGESAPRVLRLGE